MAPNKRKILEAARKHAQKGARDRALKEYEKLLKLDPRDAKLRLEIGDAYRRWGQLDDAITTYVRVAEQYMAEGFDARAVAVFKQIHNLDPERWPTYEPLAELYQRMGLAAEASAALQTAADGYHRAGQRREALGLLRKMAAIDPSNTTSRLKVADLLRQEGLSEEAAAEYEGAAEELERQGELEQAVAALGRLLEIEPQRSSALSLALRALLSLGQLDQAEPLARRLLDAEPDVPEHYEQLAEIHRRQGREEDLGGVYRRLAELYRRRGDEDRAREITQRFVPPDVLAVSGSDLDAEPSPRAAGVAPPESVGGLKGDLSGFLADAESGGEMLLDEDLLDPEPPPATPRSAPLAEETVLQRSEPEKLDADPEQLLAEACVYLRYGKCAQAVENLEAIVAAEPRHRRALEKLGEALAESDAERAVQVWLRAAGLAQEQGDTAALDVLRDRIAGLDPEAVATLGGAEEAQPELETDEIDFSDPDLGDLDLGDPGADADELETSDSDEDYLDIPHPVAPAGPDAALGEPPDGLDIEVELDDDPPGGPSATHEAEASEAATIGPGASSSSSQQVLEELEEAEFYLQQGMFDEAERIYERLRQIAPNHPQVLVRLGELAAARGEDPGDTATGLDPQARAEPEPGDEGPGAEAADDDIPDELSDWSDDLEEPAGAGEVAAADRDAPAPSGPGELTGEITSQLSDPGIEGIDPGDTGTLPPLSEEAARGLELGASGAAAAGFDLAAEIHSALDEKGDSGSADASTDGFAAVFREFKAGVSKTLAEGDHEAHYDLGIAYREMGLYDDAIGEFRAAMAGAERRVDALHMMGQCALELGRGDQAVAHLELALATAGLDDEKRLPVHYDLGRAFESLGDVHRARESWEQVVAIEPSFADVEERLAGLDDQKPDDTAGPAAGFESFDDVVEEARADAERDAPAAHGGVDFDDLVEEMNAESESGVEPAPAPAAGPETSPAGAPAGSDPPSAPSRPRRRKKISFV